MKKRLRLLVASDGIHFYSVLGRVHVVTGPDSVQITWYQHRLSLDEACEARQSGQQPVLACGWLSKFWSLFWVS